MLVEDGGELVKDSEVLPSIGAIALLGNKLRRADTRSAATVIVL